MHSIKIHHPAGRNVRRTPPGEWWFASLSVMVSLGAIALICLGAGRHSGGNPLVESGGLVQPAASSAAPAVGADPSATDTAVPAVPDKKKKVRDVDMGSFEGY